MTNDVEALTKALSVGQCLSHGAPLQVEDLSVTMRMVTFIDRVVYKYKGKVSKRRYLNICKMERKREMQKNLVLWKSLNEKD